MVSTTHTHVEPLPSKSTGFPPPRDQHPVRPPSIHATGAASSRRLPVLSAQNTLAQAAVSRSACRPAFNYRDAPIRCRDLLPRLPSCSAPSLKARDLPATRRADYRQETVFGRSAQQSSVLRQKLKQNNLSSTPPQRRPPPPIAFAPQFRSPNLQLYFSLVINHLPT